MTPRHTAHKQQPIEPDSDLARILEERLKKLEGELASSRKEAIEYLAGWKRAKADYDNLRKRTDTQRQRVVEAATEDLVQALLPVVDGLQRALGYGAGEGGKTQPVSDAQIRQGVELILRQLQNVLAGQGVSEIRAKGKKFDPTFHEAIAQVAGEEGMCISEHVVGYKLHDRVLRPCRVSVGSKVVGAA
jgi:molecular chaperone GrpE